MDTQIEASTSTLPPVDEVPLSLDEYIRYGRQMIMPGFGLPAQLRLKNAKVAVVGAGGLGCPTLQYLAASGVGTIGIFDHDTVSLSNLHRQILHTTDRVGMNKAESACITLSVNNPSVNLIPHPVPITPSTAISLLQPYSILVDCTDRPLTRYLLSDASVRLGITLVSGAAISSAGQWAVYGGSTKEGKRRACYRCIWPSVLPGSGGKCEEEGVWGVVTGLVGTGMAGEVIKLIIGKEDQEPLLHLHHLCSNPLIRTIRMKGPSPKCIACGPSATITDDLDVYGYESFCAGAMGPEVDEETGLVEGREGERINVKDLSALLSSDTQISLVDTRPPVEFGICSLPGSINIPLPTILKDPSSIPSTDEVIFLCRRGNDSQIAAEALRKISGEKRIRDVKGGLRAWSREIDPEFPIY
ncbi:adenylyltransferase and sulfurtransferase [Kwoniella mangroviensis CBS 10435]|uniref:Adenylyltransferase and sulfurtransferase n=1 Tax=Kwoniella mangroviensis CBS 10435 TaxID=1331196 RepID=A0A1B9IU16_9TREE|nr:adenylyltransferase and sulfurtransferase [Kwoniella mangroviensis CBS 10435]